MKNLLAWYKDQKVATQVGVALATLLVALIMYVVNAFLLPMVSLWLASSFLSLFN